MQPAGFEPAPSPLRPPPAAPVEFFGALLVEDVALLRRALGRQIVERADQRRRRRRRARLLVATDVKVANDARAVASDKDVGRLDVAMNDALFMNVCQSLHSQGEVR